MRYLNKESLDVISALQALRSFAICESHIYEERQDWFKTCHDYYLRLPDDVIRKAGLRKNKADFWLVLDFRITDEMGMTPDDLLDKYLLSLHD